jgi:hypothetical protein
MLNTQVLGNPNSMHTIAPLKSLGLVASRVLEFYRFGLNKKQNSQANLGQTYDKMSSF